MAFVSRFFEIIPPTLMLDSFWMTPALRRWTRLFGEWIQEFEVSMALPAWPYHNQPRLIALIREYGFPVNPTFLTGNVEFAWYPGFAREYFASFTGRLTYLQRAFFQVVNRRRRQAYLILRRVLHIELAGKIVNPKYVPVPIREIWV